MSSHRVERDSLDTPSKLCTLKIRYNVYQVFQMTPVK